MADASLFGLFLTAVLDCRLAGIARKMRLHECCACAPRKSRMTRAKVIANENRQNDWAK
jgi:hypothetical protein